MIITGGEVRIDEMIVVGVRLATVLFLVTTVVLIHQLLQYHENNA